MFGFKKKYDWGIIDCITGAFTIIDGDPFIIGTNNGADCRVSQNNGYDAECHLIRRDDGKLFLTECRGFLLNEDEINDAILKPCIDHPLRLGNNFLLIRGDTNLSEWASKINVNRWWILASSCGNEVAGPWNSAQAIQHSQKRILNGESFFGLFPEGSQISFVVDCDDVEVHSRDERHVDMEPIDEASSDLLCPNCWRRFDHGDIMHIASHHELIGDPILGEDFSQRFLATRFDDNGNALDPMGSPSIGIACPHCHTELPVNFTETSYEIISIVGNASAGKSYYLSVLSRLLPRALVRNFGIFLQDADPSSNAPLTEMRNRLFGGADAEGAALDKTVLGGNMYKDVDRYGRRVKMPRPFSFVIEGQSVGENQLGVTFFDNAGEHFQPGIELQDSPGALHVASASGIIFLFDPLRNIDFRESLKDGSDPQLKSPMNDVQSVILSEMKTRIARLRGMSYDGTNQTPIAFVVGKYDAWKQLLPENKLEPYFTEKGFSELSVEKNSAAVKNLLLELCPELVANAEGLSSNVRFFPVSSFGHTPQTTANGSIAPNPQELKPFNVEVPAIWLFSKMFKIIPLAP